MWRSRVRELVSWSLVLAALALLGLIAWASNNPGHEAIARAAGWPGVGPVVERFRVYYGVSEDQVAQRRDAEARRGDGRPAVEWQYEVVTVEGDSPYGPPDGEAGETMGLVPPEVVAEYEGTAGPDTVWIAAGDAVRRAPEASAPVVGRPEAFVQVEVLERRGEWARVESPMGAGWVHAPEVGEAYPMGSGVVPPRPLEGASPPGDQLVIARELMGVEGARGSLGPYPLYTDVEPPGRLATLDRLAAQIEPAYRRRYGRSPEGEAREAVMVFADRETYRLFQSREARIRDIPTGGYTRHGMLALWVGDRRPHDLAATLIHEVTHLLNRRAIGPALPPWLDEGMAYDLGASRVSPAGELEPGKLGGATVQQPGKVDYFGAIAGLRNLNASFARDEPPRVEELVAMDWDRFVRDDRRDLNYAHAGYFVRYLVEGEDGALAPGFRRFLDRVAGGAAPSGETLRQELGRSWEELDRGLGDFVRGKILETTPRSVPGGRR